MACSKRTLEFNQNGEIEEFKLVTKIILKTARSSGNIVLSNFVWDR